MDAGLKWQAVVGILSAVNLPLLLLLLLLLMLG